MDNKPYISIGIPALNESSNIKQLLKSLIVQTNDIYTLKEIFIISDGSTDDTVKLAKQVNDDRIQVIDNTQRVGKSAVQNQIIEMFTGEILVILDADIRLKDNRFISNLLEPLRNNSQIGLTSGKTTPLPAKSFFEKVINYSVAFKTYIYERIENTDNIFLCHGRSRAFSKAFAKQLVFPQGILSEDSWSYIMCLRLGFIFKYSKDAELFYRSPQNFKDHANQSTRYFQGKVWLEQNFKNNNIFPKISKSLLIKTIIKFFITNPVLFVTYLVFVTSLYISTIFRSTVVNWNLIKSSKNLN